MSLQLTGLGAEADGRPCAPSSDRPLTVAERQAHEKAILSRKIALLKHISQLLGSTCSHMSYLRPERLARMKEGGCMDPVHYAVGTGFNNKVLGNRWVQGAASVIVPLEGLDCAS